MKISHYAFTMASVVIVSICVFSAGDTITGSYKLSTNAQAENLRPTEHPINEARAYVNTSSVDALIDVNDSFLVRKGPAKNLENRVSFAVVDGTRSIYGDCQSGRYKKGEPSATLITIEHNNFVDGTPINIALFRTIYFKGTTLVYEFKLFNARPLVVLDKGTVVYMTNGKLIYSQHGGLIGPKGRNFLQITYDIRNSSNSLTGIVTVDDDSWTY